jgi:hypothetical protein
MCNILHVSNAEYFQKLGEGSRRMVYEMWETRGSPQVGDSIGSGITRKKRLCPDLSVSCGQG